MNAVAFSAVCPDQKWDCVGGTASDSFVGHLGASGGYLAVSSYRDNLVAIISAPAGRLRVELVPFDKPMGISFTTELAIVAERERIVVLSNVGPVPNSTGADPAVDALYVIRAAYHVGPVQPHDVWQAPSGEIAFVNTWYSCLAQVDHRASFVSTWRPAFISQTRPEDRCHLNAVALVAGEPTHVSALGEADDYEGWRARKRDGGVLISVKTGEPVLRGLCMPHTPRWIAGRLWLLNSGRGELVDCGPNAEDHTVVAQVPGFARGLAELSDVVAIGTSTARHADFNGVPVLAQARCGITLLDKRSGLDAGRLDFTAGIGEIYDVAFVPTLVTPHLTTGASRLAKRLIYHDNRIDLIVPRRD